MQKLNSHNLRISRSILDFENLASTCSKGNAFQTREFFEIYREIGWRPLVLVVCESNDPVAGFLGHTPLTAFSRVFPVLFVYRGPILVEDNPRHEEGLELLLSELISYVKRNHFLSVYIKAPFSAGKHYDLFKKLHCKIVPTGEEYSLVIDLERDLSSILKGFRRDARKRIKRSLNHLEFKEVETDTELAEFYEVYLDTAMRRSFSPFPFDFFRLIEERLRPKGFAQLLIAKYRGKTIAGAIDAVYENRSETFISCSYKQMWRFSPNHGLLWKSMCKSKESCTRFVIRCLPRQYDKTKGIDYFTYKTGFGGKIFRDYVHFSRTINPLVSSFTNGVGWLAKLVPSNFRVL